MKCVTTYYIISHILLNQPWLVCRPCQNTKLLKCHGRKLGLHRIQQVDLSNNYIFYCYR